MPALQLTMFHVLRAGQALGSLGGGGGGGWGGQDLKLSGRLLNGQTHTHTHTHTSEAWRLALLNPKD